ncbi:MAG TPA: penicillin-binding protein 2 [Gemmatimonadaceae bacterium]
MSFHPNELQRRGRSAGILSGLALGVLLVAFFRAQVIEHAEFALQSDDNRLNEVPLPAPRGMILDRNGQVIAENIPGYTVSMLSPKADSLRAALQRLSSVLPLTDSQVEVVVKRFRAAPTRPAVILSDATFEQVSMLEEERSRFPSLVIQAAPKRHYPDRQAVAAIVGYTGEINEDELKTEAYKDYKPGQQIGRAGLERQYEAIIHGKDGSRFVEVDARGRVVRQAGARPDRLPESGPDLRTTIDLDLQRFTATLFDSTMQGGAVAMDPSTGAVLAFHSAPIFDPNDFIGGISERKYSALRNDPRKPLYNKALQGVYPPASTFKLATAIIALQSGVVGLGDRMPQSCTGSYQFGTRPFRCWEKKGHGSLTLAQAIEKSCDVYFYQLGLRMGLDKLLTGGTSLAFSKATGIDLPQETRPGWPEAAAYFDRKYGKGGWTNAVTLNLSIGQGENEQTVVNMARFYTALATDGHAVRPHIVDRPTERVKLFDLTAEQMAGLREALHGVVSTRGTAASAALKGVEVAGKTGTAQNSHGKDHGWFVGFAPKDDPKIVVAVLVEFGEHGYVAARIASKMMERFLKASIIQPVNITGG